MLFRSAPELGYFGFELDEPGAWWRSFFWIDQSPPVPGAAVGFLVRTDPAVPWDADPTLDQRLLRFEIGLHEGAPWPLGFQNDALQVRGFVEYAAGAFDALTGAAHGWRTTPRVTRVGTVYLAPGASLRSVER